MVAYTRVIGDTDCVIVPDSNSSSRVISIYLPTEGCANELLELINNLREN